MNRIQKIYVTKKELGFTLVELLVVVAIIAIIATVTIFSVQSAKKNVDDKQLTQDFNELKTGLDQYKAICKTYPITLSALANNSLAQVTNPGAGACSNTFGEIMKHLDEIDSLKYKYYPLARNTSPSYCSGYWLGVELEASNGQLQNTENVTPSKMSSFLQSGYNTVSGGWVLCNGSTAQLPLNVGANQNPYFGQTSGGVCPNPSSPTCI